MQTMECSACEGDIRRLYVGKLTAKAEHNNILSLVGNTVYVMCKHSLHLAVGRHEAGLAIHLVSN